MNLSWSFGINSEIPENICNISTANEKFLFYASSNTGILYDWVNAKQKHLQGHCNKISAIASSECKRWIISADEGEDSLMIIWQINIREFQHGMPNIFEAAPIKTFFNAHDNTGTENSA